jgi:hypothetical protein
MHIPQEDSGVKAAVMNACRSVCELTCLAIPARRVTRRTIRAAPCRSSRRPSAAKEQRPLADGQIDAAGGARRQRDGDDLGTNNRIEIPELSMTSY